jgi:putative SOS response-associated peptidase YedK
MCGRYAASRSPDDLVEEFEAVVRPEETLGPDYNVAPTKKVYAVMDRRAGGSDATDAAPRRELAIVRWGLVPSWAKDLAIGDKMINARAETVAQKPAYRKAFANKRCIIPADGFYEWKPGVAPAGGGKPIKQPYFIHRRDGEPLAFAGLWEVWKVPEGLDPGLGGADGWVRSCAIVTGAPNAVLAPIHNRMPVVLPESAWEQWLDPDEHDVEALSRLLVPAPAELFEAYEISTKVNNARNNGSDLVRRLEVLGNAAGAHGDDA